MTFRCATSARDRDDAMIGTAPPQLRWLLVEHPGPWPVSAPFDAGLPTDLLRRLGHPDTRVVLVRRPAVRGSQPVAGRWRWFRADVGGAVRTGTWAEPDDLLMTLDDRAGTVHDGSLLLVCTHGVHDVCCAVRGRPVAAALQDRWPTETWECSHLGGDRFAPNVLIFPDAVCLGGLDETDAVDVVGAHLGGRLAVDHLRGFVGLPPVVQVALGAVHARFGPADPAAATGRIVDRAGDLTTVEVVAGAPLPAAATVTVQAHRGAPDRLTCRAVRETAPLVYSVTDLVVG